MNKKIAITGASGFIGNHLKNYLREKGYPVIALLRRNENGDADIRNFNLEAPQTITTSLFENIETIIHCAFVKDQNENAVDVNFIGTQVMIERAKKAGVRKFIFFSTTSAHESATSFYAKSKLSIEKLFYTEKDVVLKCGLVIGNGGLFKQLLSFAVNRKVIPIIGKGKQVVQFVSVDSVATAIEHILQTDISGTYVLAQPESINYKQLFIAIKKYFSIRLVFLPISFFILKTIITVTKKLNIQLPVSQENLLGLKAMRAWDSKRDMETLQLPNEKLEDILKRYFPERQVI